MKKKANISDDKISYMKYLIDHSESVFEKKAFSDFKFNCADVPAYCFLIAGSFGLIYDRLFYKRKTAKSLFAMEMFLFPALTTGLSLCFFNVYHDKTFETQIPNSEITFYYHEASFMEKVQLALHMLTSYGKIEKKKDKDKQK